MTRAGLCDGSGQLLLLGPAMRDDRGTCPVCGELVPAAGDPPALVDHAPADGHTGDLIAEAPGLWA